MEPLETPSFGRRLSWRGERRLREAFCCLKLVEEKSKDGDGGERGT